MSHDVSFAHSSDPLMIAEYVAELLHTFDLPKAINWRSWRADNPVVRRSDALTNSNDMAVAALPCARRSVWKCDAYYLNYALAA